VTDFNATRKQIDKLVADVEVISGSKSYWFRLDENGEIVGGIAKFLQEKKDEVIKALNLQPNTFVALSAGSKGAAQKTAGVLIKQLGALCPKHMDKERYEFCWIVDFPMYEIGEESGELEFCHNPFSMPNGGLEILEQASRGEVDPLSITAYQYDLFMRANYFYRPMEWSGTSWRFRVYTRYTNRSHYYYAQPSVYGSYRGGHMRTGTSHYANRHYTQPTPMGNNWRQNGSAHPGGGHQPRPGSSATPPKQTTNHGATPQRQTQGSWRDGASGNRQGNGTTPSARQNSNPSTRSSSTSGSGNFQGRRK
jgi:hypothetical protein